MLGSFGRSGSSSIRAALEALGMRPLHGADLVNDPELVDALVHRDAMALVELTEKKGFDGGLEQHRCVRGITSTSTST